MADPKDDGPDEKLKRSDDDAGPARPGHAVWQWAADSGRNLIVSTTALLRRLDVPGLKLEDDAGTPRGQPGVARDDSAARANTGYDPYGSKRATSAKALHPAARPRPVATKPAAVPPRRRSWWRRLFGRD